MEQVLNEVKFKLMTVSNSIQQLNVREAPKPNAKVLMLLDKGMQVNVNLIKSTEDYFYVASIVTNEKKIPVHGFCKREFILE